ncbi:sugar ABC transporter substrate-binding protein, partial [Mesorhizobium sp. M7A.F.Ca.CA.001.10.2.1]
MTWNKQTLIKMLMTAVSGAAVVSASLPARAAEPITLHALMEDVPETKIIEA